MDQPDASLERVGLRGETARGPGAAHRTRVSRSDAGHLAGGPSGRRHRSEANQHGRVLRRSEAAVAVDAEDHARGSGGADGRRRRPHPRIGTGDFAADSRQRARKHLADRRTDRHQGLRRRSGSPAAEGRRGAAHRVGRARRVARVRRSRRRSAAAANRGRPRPRGAVRAQRGRRRGRDRNGARRQGRH